MAETAAYKKLNNAGMKALAAGNRSKAELLFTAAIAADGSNISAYMNLVSCHLSGKDLHQALLVLNAMRKKCNPVQLTLAAADISRFEALTSSAIKKRFLLVSLDNTFESRLFTLAFTDLFGRAKGVLLDIAMPRLDCFRKLEPSGFSYGKRLPVERKECFGEIAGNEYDAIIFIDFPESGSLDGFCRLLALKGPRKTFVNLHLAYGKGDSTASDLIADKKLFQPLDAMFILDNDTFAANRKYGVPAGKMRKYTFSVNAGYYAPIKGSFRPYLASAGNSARDYGALLSAMEGLDTELKIYTDLDLETGRSAAVNLSVHKLGGNLELLKDELGGALAVVIPFRPAVSPAANSILTIAMSLGKVVLTNETAALRKLVKAGVNGFFYDENLPGDLRTKISYILSLTKERRELIGTRARETVLAKADYRHLAGKVYAALLPGPAIRHI